VVFLVDHFVTAKKDASNSKQDTSNKCNQQNALFWTVVVDYRKRVLSLIVITIQLSGPGPSQAQSSQSDSVQVTNISY